MAKNVLQNKYSKIFLGPSIAIVVIGLIEYSTETAYPVPPISPLFLLMAATGYYAGTLSSLLTGLVALVYFSYTATNPESLYFVPNNSWVRILVWSFTIPLTALIIGALKKRTEAPLKKQVVELEKSKEALRQSEERFRQIVNAAHDALIVIDSKSNIVEWNPQAEVIFGWKRSEALGKELTSTIIPDRYASAHLKGLAHYLQSGEGPVLNRRFEISARNKSNTEIPVELTIYPFQQDNQTFFGSFLHDISEKRMAEQTISSQLQITRVMMEADTVTEAINPLLEAIVKSIDFQVAEIWLFNHTHKLTLRGMRIPDNTYKPFLEKSFEMVLESDDAFAVKRLEHRDCDWIVDVAATSTFDRQELAKKVHLHTCVSAKIHDGSETFGVLNVYNNSVIAEDKKIIEILAEAGRKIGLFLRRRNTEEELEKLNQELEQKVNDRTRDLELANESLHKEAAEKALLYEQAQTANRLKDEFIATVSHELRTPLNVIIGYSDMLCTDPLSDEERREYYDIINRNAKIQSQIVNDILDISRVVTGKLKLNITDVNINDVIEAAIGSVAYTANSKNIEISKHIDPVASSIAGDFGRLQQVFWNILSNAIKFTPRYGHIEITTSVVESQVRVAVKDDGQGIEASFLPYVFERFRQEDASTTRRHGGLGLGLSICRNIVEQHGGVIEAQSAGKNQGSTFVVTLPINAVKVALTLPKDQGSVQTLPLRGLRLLVVEDQIDALNLLAKLLSRAGAEVYTASSATEGLKKVIANRPDVLISDIGMPEYDGYYLIEMVRKLDPRHGGSIPAIALTAYAAPEDLEKALRSGFQVHVAKPVEGSELINIIRQWAKKPLPPEPPLSAP
ncbi:ATP-binding protein [Bdellovibrio sp. HCB2-146]|uniref:PAS domain-containing hybrid sensor histidine kinase/response regulator n=1 Tax=Bdellovibrio sp. HCB2-146 TaxID=3394362 RepID=UPI0039BD22FD